MGKKECCPEVESHGPNCSWAVCFADRDALSARVLELEAKLASSLEIKKSLAGARDDLQAYVCKLKDRVQELEAALKQYADGKFWEYGCGCCCVPKDAEGDKDWDRMGEVTAGDLARRTLQTPADYQPTTRNGAPTKSRQDEELEHLRTVESAAREMMQELGSDKDYRKTCRQSLRLALGNYKTWLHNASQSSSDSKEKK